MLNYNKGIGQKRLSDWLKCIEYDVGNKIRSY